MGEPAKEGMMSEMKATQKSAKSTTATGKKTKGFMDDERGAHRAPRMSLHRTV
jgi:hypothetical protein